MDDKLMDLALTIGFLLMIGALPLVALKFFEVLWSRKR